jgi:hypothetical protein
MCRPCDKTETEKAITWNIVSKGKFGAQPLLF